MGVSLRKRILRRKSRITFDFQEIPLIRAILHPGLLLQSQDFIVSLMHKWISSLRKEVKSDRVNLKNKKARFLLNIDFPKTFSLLNTHEILEGKFEIVMRLKRFLENPQMQNPY